MGISILRAIFILEAFAVLLIELWKDFNDTSSYQASRLNEADMGAAM